jgi:hypothetical protein
LDEMVEVGSHLRGVSTVGATEVARQRRPRRWGHSGGRRWWLGGPAAPVRHGGGKGGFKQQERARRRGSPRGQVGVGAAANFYGEAAAPGVGAAPRGRGDGGGGNRCSGVDEREMGQKKGDEAAAGGFSSDLVVRGKDGKRGGGPTGAVAWRRRGREEGADMVVGSAGRPATAPGCRAWVAALPREQGRGRARATRCRRLTHGPERDGGPDVSGGVWERAGERGRATMGCRQAGPGNTVPGQRFNRYFEPIQNI